MARKDYQIIEMMQMINFLKKDQMDIFDIAVLNEFTNMPVEELLYKENILDDYDEIELFGFDDEMANKKKRYLN